MIPLIGLKNEDEMSKHQFVALSNVLNANLFCYWGLEIERVLFRGKNAREKLRYNKKNRVKALTSNITH